MTLADGMGGLSFGDLGAELITKCVAEYVEQNYRGSNEAEILLAALHTADSAVRRKSMEMKSKMGAAVAVAIINDGKLYCMWQGNVRVYVRRSNDIALLTTDHIADVGYGNTALTRCVKGGGLREDVPFLSCPVKDGDSVLICSDGLYKMVENMLGVASVEELKAAIGNPEDDATLVRVTLE